MSARESTENQPNKTTQNETISNEFESGDPWIQIELAKRRLANYMSRTMLRRGRPIAMLPDFNISFKCEQLRPTGSFKERGACNALLRLTPEECEKGVIAASAGNHAQALAYYGQKLHVPVTVVMPKDTPLIKHETCRSHNANVILHGDNFNDALKLAEEIVAKKSLKYINGYDHPDVIAGAGTCGLEILRQKPDVDAVVVPCGGGGLLAGVSVAIKRINPNVRVYGIESERCASMTQALRARKPVHAQSIGGTIAEGLAVVRVGTNALKLVQRYVDAVYAIPEHFISIAILHLLEKEKLLCEGAGCAGLAGLMSGKLDHLRGKQVVTILCGGNIDMTTLGRVLERGLYSAGRLLQFDCAISDRVGGLARFCACLSRTGASVKEIVQERPFITDVNVCCVHLTIESLNHEHCQKIVESMRREGYVLKLADDKKYDDVDLTKLYTTKTKL